MWIRNDFKWKKTNIRFLALWIIYSLGTSHNFTLFVKLFSSPSWVRGLQEILYTGTFDVLGIVSSLFKMVVPRSHDVLSPLNEWVESPSWMNIERGASEQTSVNSHVMLIYDSSSLSTSSFKLGSVNKSNYISFVLWSISFIFSLPLSLSRVGKCLFV